MPEIPRFTSIYRLFLWQMEANRGRKGDVDKLFSVLKVLEHQLGVVADVALLVAVRRELSQVVSTSEMATWS